MQSEKQVSSPNGEESDICGTLGAFVSDELICIIQDDLTKYALTHWITLRDFHPVVDHTMDNEVYPYRGQIRPISVALFKWQVRNRFNQNAKRELDKQTKELSMEGEYLDACVDKHGVGMRSRDQDPFHQVALAELKQKIEEAVGAESRIDRGVFLLHFYGGMPFTEIGSRFGFTGEAARRRYHRTLQRIKNALQSIADED